MEEVVEAADGHVLGDHHQVGGRVAAAQHREHVGVGEDSQLRVLLVEVPGEEEEEKEEEQKEEEEGRRRKRRRRRKMRRRRGL